MANRCHNWRRQKKGMFENYNSWSKPRKSYSGQILDDNTYIMCGFLNERIYISYMFAFFYICATEKNGQTRIDWCLSSYSKYSISGLQAVFYLMTAIILKSAGDCATAVLLILKQHSRKCLWRWST